MLVDDAMIGDVTPLIYVMTAFVGLAQIVTTWLPSPCLSLSLFANFSCCYKKQLLPFMVSIS